MTLDLDALERLARAVPPGPDSWFKVEDIARSIGDLSASPKLDALYITALSPSVVLALIERLRAAEGDRDVLVDRYHELTRSSSEERRYTNKYISLLHKAESERNTALARAEKAEAEREKLWSGLWWMLADPPEEAEIKAFHDAIESRDLPALLRALGETP